MRALRAERGLVATEEMLALCAEQASEARAASGLSLRCVVGPEVVDQLAVGVRVVKAD
jgi:hypothetical protein